MSGRLSDNFKRQEFACHHCGKLPDDPPEQLLVWLESVRNHFGMPVVIVSGYRCPTHNANVGGATKSKHMEGIAADITVKGVKPDVVHQYLSGLMRGAGGLGQYKNFTHVDTRAKSARW